MYPTRSTTFKNIVRPVSAAPAAKNVIFLSADAFGVLPPVSILTPEQTQYYFLSGFTAKLAGTERGITEPTPTFSACFGQAFLELHPTKYAEELVKKMEKSGAKAYLVNTGWNGTGKRISIKDTRGIIDAILNGAINAAPTKTDPVLQLRSTDRASGRRYRHPRSARYLRRCFRVGDKGKGSGTAVSSRTSQNTKATQLARLWLQQVRRLNRPTLRKTRDFYPNIKKAVRSGFIPGGQPSSLYILQIFISVSHLCVSPP